MPMFYMSMVMMPGYMFLPCGFLDVAARFLYGRLPQHSDDLLRRKLCAW